jgi:hypothetical protein
MTYAVRPVTSFDRGAAHSPSHATRNWRCLSDCSVAAFGAEFNTTPIKPEQIIAAARSATLSV